MHATRLSISVYNIYMYVWGLYITYIYGDGDDGRRDSARLASDLLAIPNSYNTNEHVVRMWYVDIYTFIHVGSKMQPAASAPTVSALAAVAPS